MNGDVRMSTPAAPGRSSAPGPDRKDEGFQIDFLTWRARLSAPGSRFALAQAGMRDGTLIQTSSGRSPG
jgi:hypothetical protein